MKSGKFWLAVLVGGVVANVLDYLAYTYWLGPTFMKANTALFRTDVNVAWYFIGDFVAVFVFAFVFDKVSSVFGTTPKAGAMAGLYLGIFATFPAMIFMHLTFNGYPYGLSWASIIYGVVWYMIVGAILAFVMKKGATT
jgi:hypothetical protein